MISRYARPEMAGLWTDAARYRRWTQVEVLAAEAWAALGLVPEADLAAIRAAPPPSVARVCEAEREREHEVLAFLAAYTAPMPPTAAGWVHYGMTSYDLVDTALGRTLAEACDLVLTGAGRLLSALLAQAQVHWETPCVARTHGVHAEPTTFGQRLAGYAFAVERSRIRLRAARRAVAVGTLSGPVGTYAQIDPRVEESVCAALGLAVEPMPTQVVARDRHAELLGALAVLGASVEQIGLELRLLQQTEIAEVEEPRGAAYQGSSAMPHKRNPTVSERLCGLARLLRANAGAGYENVALWHERDLAHSSVERVVLPDSLTVAHYQVTTAAEVIEGLTVRPERMAENLATTGGLIYSSAAYLELVAAGVDRETAYRAVQGAAGRAWRSGASLGDALAIDGWEVPPDRLRPERYLTSRDHLRERMTQLAKESSDDVEDRSRRW